MRVKFTAGKIAALICPPEKSQVFIWDTDNKGLGLKASPGGAKKYILESRLKSGNTIRITIGDPKTWSIDAAQIEARRLQTLIDQGIDPRHQKAAQLVNATAQRIEAKRLEVTLGDLWPHYIESRRPRWSEWHIRDHENIAHRGGLIKVRGKGFTKAGPLASLLDVRLSDLTGKVISKWLATEAATRPTRAALSFRLLSVFVNWCNSQSEYVGIVPTGACKAQQVRDQMPSKNTKEGDSLQREQLALWFKAVREMGNPVQSAYLQALLLTGARRRELSSLRWDDVDFQWLSMTIRDKVEGERTIPLCPYVASLLVALPRRSEWVFSSLTAVNGQLSEPTPGHKRALKSAGLPDLTLHGLRRSFGSLAEWVEVPAGITAQIMGHKPSAIAEKHYLRRPLDLLRMWHVKIEKWILEQADIDLVVRKPDLKIISGS
jgi:integrase